MTGTPRAAACCATTNGALARSVCRSLRPSPVIAQSASASAASRPIELGHDLGAERTCRPASCNAKPSPPAAPAPGLCATRAAERALPPASAKRPSAASSVSTSPGAHALLRTEDRGRAQRAGQRIVDVRHDAEFALARCRGSSAAASTRASDASPSGVGGSCAPARVEQRERRAREQAAAAVVGAAAAQPDHEAAHAAVEQRARPARRRRASSGRSTGVGMPARVGDADDLRDLDHRRRVSSGSIDAVRGVHRVAPSAPRDVARRVALPAAPTAASTASSVPSPPSAIGRARIVRRRASRARGRARAPRRRRARSSEPLNESGARTMRMHGRRRACARDVSRDRRRRRGVARASRSRTACHARVVRHRLDEDGRGARRRRARAGWRRGRARSASASLRRGDPRSGELRRPRNACARARRPVRRCRAARAQRRRGHEPGRRARRVVRRERARRARRVGIGRARRPAEHARDLGRRRCRRGAAASARRRRTRRSCSRCRRRTRRRRDQRDVARRDRRRRAARWSARCGRSDWPTARRCPSRRPRRTRAAARARPDATARAARRGPGRR